MQYASDVQPKVREPRLTVADRTTWVYVDGHSFYLLLNLSLQIVLLKKQYKHKVKLQDKEILFYALSFA